MITRIIKQTQKLIAKLLTRYNIVKIPALSSPSLPNDLVQKCLFWLCLLCLSYKAVYSDSCIWEQLKTNFILVPPNPETGTSSMEKSVSKLNNEGFSRNRCFFPAAVKTLKQSYAPLSGHATTTKQGINFATYCKYLLRAAITLFKNSNRDFLWVIMRPFYPLNECKALQFMPTIPGTKPKG